MKDKEKISRIGFVLVESFEYFITLFVTGTMLGYILDTLGFSDSLQGILGTVATFTCGAQLFTLFLSQKKTKNICVIGNSINQAAFVILYLLPLLRLSPNAKSALLVILLLIGHVINNAVRPSKLAMFMDSVPMSKRGSFTAVKEMISLVGGIIISLIMGRVADVYRDGDGLPTREYYVISAIALLAMTLMHTASVLMAEEKPLKMKKSGGACDVIRRISKNGNFVKVVIVGLLWNVASAFSISFFASYLREELAFSFTLIAILSTVSSVARIIASPIFGRVSDKYSFATAMTVGFIFAGLAFLTMVFTFPETRWLYIVYTCLYGFSMAIINSGVINLVYDYVEHDDRATAMGVKNALGGILAFFTALVSGAVMEFIRKKGGLNVFGINVYAQQLLSLFSVIAVVILVIYMRLVIAPLSKAEDAVIDNSNSEIIKK